MKREKVLFLCTGNSARSQMAEAMLRRYAGDQFEVHSAGLEPSVIHPYTVKVLEEAGLDTSGQYSKPLTDYIGKTEFDYLITVCSSADEKCPVFPGMGKRIHWPFEDPGAFEGSDAAKIEKFREIRDKIKAKVTAWLEQVHTV